MNNPIKIKTKIGIFLSLLLNLVLETVASALRSKNQKFKIRKLSRWTFKRISYTTMTFNKMVEYKTNKSILFKNSLISKYDTLG